jgi:UDPglucose 6-dehydrogenase
VHTAEVAGYDFGLLRSVIDGNHAQHARMVDKVRDACGGELGGARVAAWGLTFKANTDDLRESPALAIVSQLVAQGAQVRAYDPRAGEAAASAVQGLEIVSDPYAACADAQVLAVLTEWDEFRWLDYARVAEMMQSATIVDTRNLLDPAALRRLGFVYRGVGR